MIMETWPPIHVFILKLLYLSWHSFNYSMTTTYHMVGGPLLNAWKPHNNNYSSSNLEVGSWAWACPCNQKFGTYSHDVKITFVVNTFVVDPYILTTLHINSMRHEEWCALMMKVASINLLMNNIKSFEMRMHDSYLVVVFLEKKIHQLLDVTWLESIFNFSFRSRTQAKKP